jgi:hypothetical protein
VALFTDSPDVDVRPANGSHETIVLAELEARPIRVVFCAIPTLLAVADAVHGRGVGVPSSWTRAARCALGARELRALRPVVERPGEFLPDRLLSLPDGQDGDFDPEPGLKWIAETGGESLLDELTADDAPGVVEAWVGVAKDPRRWAIR